MTPFDCQLFIKERNMSTASKESAPPKTISNAGGFIAGGVAACGAVTVTNPIELIKTR